ncbi:MAG: glycosyltransferase [Myxococcota bacterium]
MIQALNPTRDPFDRAMDELPGDLSAREGRLLRKLASQLQCGCVVDVGSRFGKSAIALAAGVTQQVPAPSVYCIEPHGGPSSHSSAEERGGFYQAMLATDAYRVVKLVNLPSAEAAPTFRETVELLVLDSKRSYADVERDFRAWEPRLSADARVVFAGSSDSGSSLNRLAAELFDSGGYSLEASLDSLTVLRRAHSYRGHALPASPQRLLVVCHEAFVTGGLLRFERVGRVARAMGHELVFCQMHPGPVRKHFEAPVISWESAQSSYWDATLVPGAGFPAATLNRLDHFRGERFGLRIQHILNDPSRRAAFLAVNRRFEPDVVVFNNRHWTPGSYTEFQAKEFHTVVGGVDPLKFSPWGRARESTYVIGGLSHKNPEPLIAALRELPELCTLRLFGPTPPELQTRHRDLIESGRLTLLGVLSEEELPGYYQSIDAVVMTEESAGWSNLVAEAMASGVPVVCTRHGTEDLAHHRKTAWVIESPDMSQILSGIETMRQDRSLADSLARKAREHVLQFAWEPYTRRLLAVGHGEKSAHYLHAPRFGLFGKWPLEDRLLGLEPLYERVRGASVLDLGAAEGAVSRVLLEHGAASCRGFEVDADRVHRANSLCSGFDAQFWHGDLSSWPSFQSGCGEHLAPIYDVVLYLGLHHHLPKGARMEVLAGALKLAQTLFAIRTPSAVWASDELDSFIRAHGFDPLFEEAVERDRAAGSAKIYRRRSHAT